MTLTQERLKELLRYDPETGLFYWLVARKRGGAIGDLAGHTSRQGYVVLGVDGKHYKAHRLAWLYFHGEMPTAELDHINLNKSDNRVENLRLASRSQNRSNTRAYKNSASGQKGVSLHGMTGRWQASISANGKQKYLGLFDNRDDAVVAYACAANEMHGEFARVA